MRPYGPEIAAWLKSSEQDESRLLRGTALAEALGWERTHNLPSPEDSRFLRASEAFERKEQTNRRGFLFSSVAAVMLLGLALSFGFQAQQSQEELKQISILLQSLKAAKSFEKEQIRALVITLNNADELQNLQSAKASDINENLKFVKESVTQILALILDNIAEKNQLAGHQGPIRVVQFSPDGQYLVSAGQDSVVRIWSKDGKLRIELPGHQGNITSASFSLDGLLLATAGEDDTIRLWTVQGEEKRTWKADQDEVRSLSFSPDGQYLVSGGQDGTVKIWTWQQPNQAPVRWPVDQSPVTNVVMTANNRIITSGTEGIKIWTFNRKLIFSAVGDQVAISSDRKQIAIAKKTGEVASIEFNHSIDSTEFEKEAPSIDLEKQKIYELPTHNSPISSLSFKPVPDQDAEYWLAIADNNGSIRIWSSRLGQLMFNMVGHQGPIHTMSFSPDENQLATGGEDGLIKIWQIGGKSEGKVSYPKTNSSQDLKGLVKQGCDFLRDYFSTHPDRAIKPCEEYLKPSKLQRDIP